MEFELAAKSRFSAHGKFFSAGYHKSALGFSPLGKLQNLESPIVWSVHDMRAFTGGCHYDNFCGRFTDACGSCPQLKGKEKDLSRKIFRKKEELWSKLPITFVAGQSR